SHPAVARNPREPTGGTIHAAIRAMAEHRDIVVIGASAGGVTALRRVLGQLPASLGAAVFIVQHTAAESELDAILQRKSQLPVRWAQHGDRIELGTITIAPPGFHLLLDHEFLRLDTGPRENHARPSINKMFRSAAARFGSRTIGVLLTGMLDDGVIGL